MPPECHAKTEGTGDWEQVVAPIDCNYYAIYAPTGQLFDKCGDPNDANTELGGQSQFVIIAPVRHETRWNKGAVITWVRSSQPLNLYFLK